MMFRFFEWKKNTAWVIREELVKAMCLLLPENDALQVEGVFYDPSGWDSNPKHVLLGWQIGRISDTIQIA